MSPRPRKTPEPVADAPVETPTPKRRGRPRKSDAAPAAVAAETPAAVSHQFDLALV